MGYKLLLKKNSGEKGAIAIILTILIMTVSLLIAMGLSMIFIGETKRSRLVGYTSLAFYAADAGAEYALYQIIHADPELDDPINCPVAGPIGCPPIDKCSKTIEFASGAKVDVCWGFSDINSLGFFGGTRRRVTINW